VSNVTLDRQLLASGLSWFGGPSPSLAERLPEPETGAVGDNGSVNVRLIATDLDGTLLRSDGTVSERTVRALRSAEAAGVTVVVATGRPPRWMVPVAEVLGHTGLAVCANGAVVVDLHSEQVTDVRPLGRDVLMKIAELVRQAVPEVHFAVETARRGFGQEPGYLTHADDDRRDAWVAPIDALAADDVIKLLVQHHTMGPDDLLMAAREVAGDVAELTHSSRDGLLEVSASGVTKASTLARIADRHGVVPEQVVAFGDMPNDLPMLAWAGAGYAMENAHPEVLAAAGRFAPANDADGVAHVIESLLPANA
jgi:Cof subfamily protein (haloacid dehalogenase superfamily)